MKKEKKIVRNFYETYGWEKNDKGVYRDAVAFVDIRPVLDSYRHETHLRVKKFLHQKGKYFLDAGSGAIPHPEYLEYSSGYSWRICADISLKALNEAREKVKDRGFYVLADVTMLPFKSGVFTGVVSAHVIYHVPKDEQSSAVFELIRTMKEDGRCIIIYSWPMAFIKKVASVIGCSLSWIRSVFKRRSLQDKALKETEMVKDGEKLTKEIPPEIYSYRFPFSWFKKTFPEDWEMKFLCWRSVDPRFTKSFVPDNAIGRLIMKWIFKFETQFSHFMGRVGRYSMIIIKFKIGE